MKSKIFENKKTNKRTNKRIVTIALAIVTMLALLMTGCSASKSDEERWNDTKNIVSADSLKDDADYSKFDKKKESSKDNSKENSNSEDNAGSTADEETGSNSGSEESAGSTSKSNGSSTESTGNTGNIGSTENTGSTESETSTTTSSTCTISISCATILNNMDDLTPGKEVLVPSNGVILGATQIEFTDGETVFDILARLTRDNGIHMEYVNTPAYNSAYIEGIANLYEKDCGGGSGWMYCVNGWYPDYGCSQYYVKDGDVIQWNYTCDLGVDLGQTF